LCRGITPRLDENKWQKDNESAERAVKKKGQCAGRPARSRWWKSTAMKA
jgi:hypothetical protein